MRHRHVGVVVASQKEKDLRPMLPDKRQRQHSGSARFLNARATATSWRLPSRSVAASSVAGLCPLTIGNAVALDCGSFHCPHGSRSKTDPIQYADNFNPVVGFGHGSARNYAGPILWQRLATEAADQSASATVSAAKDCQNRDAKRIRPGSGPPSVFERKR